LLERVHGTDNVQALGLFFCGSLSGELDCAGVVVSVMSLL
jgi:hypothetical protein